MKSHLEERLLASIAAFALAALLSGCVVYPGDGGYTPAYAGYGGYGGYGGMTSVTVLAPGRAYEGYGPYRGAEHHGTGGWQDSRHHVGGGRHVEEPRRREHGYGG